MPEEPLAALWHLPYPITRYCIVMAPESRRQCLEVPQLPHEPPLHEPHEPPDDGEKLDPLLKPNFDSSRATSAEPQSGHSTVSSHERTSVSKVRPQLLHL